MALAPILWMSRRKTVVRGKLPCTPDYLSPERQIWEPRLDISFSSEHPMVTAGLACQHVQLCPRNHFNRGFETEAPGPDSVVSG